MMFVKAWVLVLILDGTTTDLGPKMNINDCHAAMKRYIEQHLKQKYNVRCEWRT